VECVERGLDPFKARLAVADPEREQGTICLAITPAMKALGIKNRCRVFEIPPSVDYIKAKPRMQLYMDKSAEIYGVYLKYISPDDIHVYSIDECFFDLTPYMKLYKKNAYELVDMLRDAVLRETKIPSSAGIGTNLFLAKVALDITAKKSPSGVGYLDEELFKATVAKHRPITDIWNIGPGTARSLAKMGIFDLAAVAAAPPEILKRRFGVNAEYLIDHANGRESCTIADIKAYRPRATSISNSQVLFEPYSFEDARLILEEMVEGQVLELVGSGRATDTLSLNVGYNYTRFGGEIIEPPATGGSVKLPSATNSFKKIWQSFLSIYERTTDKSVPVRRIGISLGNLVSERCIAIDFFTDPEKEDREHALLKAMVNIKSRFGKNAILKATSYTEKATARARNLMIGGHNGY